MEGKKVNVQLKELFDIFFGGRGIRSIAFCQELRKKTSQQNNEKTNHLKLLKV